MCCWTGKKVNWDKAGFVKQLLLSNSFTLTFTWTEAEAMENKFMVRSQEIQRDIHFNSIKRKNTFYESSWYIHKVIKLK